MVKRKYFNFLKQGENEVMIEEAIKRYENNISKRKSEIKVLEAKILFFHREKYFLMEGKQKTLEFNNYDKNKM